MSNIFNMAQYILKDKGDKTALLIKRSNGIKKVTYNEMNEKANQVANYLKDIGINKGEIVSVYLDKSAELFPIVLGILKSGAVYLPLFSSFGSSSLGERINDSKPSLMITSSKLEKKLVGLNIDFKILVLDCNKTGLNFNSNIYLDYYKKINNYSKEYDMITTNENDIASIFYTSGTTSTPKGVVHTHKEIKRYLKSFEEVFKPDENDNYWCTADHAWITGSVYGIFAPLAKGVTNVINNYNLSAKKIYNFIDDSNINIWYTAPTFLRILLKQKIVKEIKNIDFSKLKSIYSVGESLNPNTIKKVNNIFGLIIRNTWFQTETGSIILSNFSNKKEKFGSLGKPLSDVEIAIMDDDFNILPYGKIGKLVIKSGWQSMFVNYLNKEELFEETFKKGWYITGDLAKKDKDGYYWFVSREDDIINVAGHLVNPIEIENNLKDEEFIDNVIATSISDSTMGQRVKLVIVLKDNYQERFELELKIKKLIRDKLSHYEVPKEINFVDKLETTQSGKIIRN